jgi:hypothetical protein
MFEIMHTHKYNYLFVSFLPFLFYFILTVGGSVRRLVAVGLILVDDGIVDDGIIPVVGGYIGRDDTTCCCRTAVLGILII